jgi:hypothetical protein
MIAHLGSVRIPILCQAYITEVHGRSGMCRSKISLQKRGEEQDRVFWESVFGTWVLETVIDLTEIVTLSQGIKYQIPTTQYPILLFSSFP